MKVIALFALLGLAAAVPTPQDTSSLEAQLSAFLQSLSASGSANGNSPSATGNTLVLPSSIVFDPVIGGASQ
ncbi:hypothetical protein AMS68_003735 [Peltaster fructicola]|uniref:Uncharacterized protein n=1 Tax=Peltaster fructicola TaxID=286661 RepID=A0A6H0XUC6_9PEZI|nr:hypothetical protein AMS68_003735 [Peltaster fructicola]